MEKKITAKEALGQIKLLEYTFFGNRQDLHKEIKKIISKVK